MSKRKTVCEFFKKLGALLGAGIPLADALDSFAQDPLDEPYAEVPLELANGLREGKSLSALLTERNDLFNPMTVEMVAAGERQGNLDILLPQIADKVVEGLLDPKESRKNLSTVNFEPSGLARLVKFITTAAERGASDLHLESGLDGGKVRLRVDGLLFDHEALSKDELKTLIAAAKHMFKCDPAEHRLPQDGRARMTLDGEPQVMRICTVPFTTGESATIRLLARLSVNDIPPLEGVFGTEDLLDKVKRVVSHPYGMVVVSGPTGSGKTTTMYSLLAALASPEKKIFSIEDPVELALPGVQQLAVNHSIGLTFRKGLLAALRSDPDVICAGEIRDLETAEILLQSALAGHKVLTSLHGKDAVSSLLRTLNVGLEGPLLADGLQAIIGQRLVRKLCPNCKIPFDQGNSEQQEATKELISRESTLTTEGVYLPIGCDKCVSGFKGRLAVHEFLPITSAIGRLLGNEPTYEEIFTAATKEGFVTQWQDGLRLVQSGETSAGEILRSLADTCGI